MFFSLIHLCMLGLNGIIDRLGPSNILCQHGVEDVLSSKPVNSWISTICNIYQLYNLNDPLIILQSPIITNNKDVLESHDKIQTYAMRNQV